MEYSRKNPHPRLSKPLSSTFRSLFGFSLLGACFIGLLAQDAQAEPLLDSWFTKLSGRYATLYPTLTEEAAVQPAITWNRGAGIQILPTYSGVNEISFDASNVYIRTSGLPFHTMGPWYGNEEKTNLFPNYPSNRAQIFRFPRVTPAFPSQPVPTGLGAIGYFVDGVAMFDSRDAFSFSFEEGRDAGPGTTFRGDGVWNRDAYVNESVTFDSANAHQAGNNHHYHANPPGLRHLLGDSVDFDEATNTYTENFNGKHSPILAWVSDGIPLYGPYGYSDPQDSTSPVRRMITGYRPRNLANGSPRDSLPQWVVSLEQRSTTVAANETGPNVGNQYPVGHYLEDYEYKGDVGFTLGSDFDLDEFNGRFCVTPEFPEGRFVYFCAIEADGTPVYPYNIARAFRGDPVGDAVNNLPNGVTVFWEGGPETRTRMKSISADDSSGDITLTWSSVQGGSYKIEGSTDGATWTEFPLRVKADSEETRFTDGARAERVETLMYRPSLEGIREFDDTGFAYDSISVIPALDVIRVLLTDGAGGPPPEDLNVLPSSVTLNGDPVPLLSRPSQYVAEIEIDLSSLDDGETTLSVEFPNATIWTGTYQQVQNPNVLLLIVDDWGVDSSPVDNSSTLNPGTTFASMANLEDLAANGVRFTRAYSQPVCSPTRASIITGRLPFRTGVGFPNAPILDNELTLPEVFADAGSPYRLASYGKWHLGGGDTGYSTLGGWPEFIGINSGGVPEPDGYYDWNRNNNGTVANSTTYSTTDQVTEAKSFIDARETANEPWFVWMGFNAPHTPFHEPPANLLQGGTGGNNKALYQKALEALDTEIGRLLESVDLNTTNVILVGDNGTPAQVVQAPYGPTGAQGHSKGDLYEGGIHVPFVVRGPSVVLPGGSTSDKLVSVTDLFATILEMANVPLPGTGVDSRSINPILSGAVDTVNRSVIAETFTQGTTGGEGRSIRMDTHSDYKLIIFGDPDDTQDLPVHELYFLPTDPNENSPLDLNNLSVEAQAAYDAALALDVELGGTFNDPPSGPEDTLYIELPTETGPTGVPANLNVDPVVITVDGVMATFEARVDSNEATERYWVKCVVPENPPYTSATVTFPDNPNTGDSRVFDSIQIIVAP